MQSVARTQDGEESLVQQVKRLPRKFSKAKAGEENKHLLTSRKQIPSITGRIWILQANQAHFPGV